MYTVYKINYNVSNKLYFQNISNMSCNLIRKSFNSILHHKIINRMRAFDWNIEIIIVQLNKKMIPNQNEMKSPKQST